MINRSVNGDHYWVLAHVTPSYDDSGNVTEYHSSRRTVDRAVLDDTIIPLYKSLLDEENRHTDRKAGMQSSFDMVLNLLKDKGMDYDELVFSL